MRYVFLALLLMLTTACSQRAYHSPALVPQALTQHQLVAVLPFEVQLNRLDQQAFAYIGDELSQQETEQRQRRWEQKQQELRKQMSYELQRQLLKQLTGRQAKHPYSVQFQEVQETNARLEKAGITYEDLNDHTMAELKAALGVDAILSGQTSLVQTMPNGVAVALLVLTNAGFPPNEVVTILTIHDCTSGDLVWEFNHELVGELSTSPATLARMLVRNSARAFPYRR